MPRGNPSKLTAEQWDRRKKREPKVCQSCRGGLDGMHYFCRSCFFLAPAGERVALFNLHHRAQDCTSKVAKIVRLIHADHPELIPAGFPGHKPKLGVILIDAAPVKVEPFGARLRLATKQEADVLTRLRNARAKSP